MKERKFFIDNVKKNAGQFSLKCYIFIKTFFIVGVNSLIILVSITGAQLVMLISYAL